MPYDSTNHYLYRNTATTPAQGISIADIMTATKNNSTDLGTLCQSLKVNKWAKYKPQRSSNPGMLTNLQRAMGQWGFSVNGEDTIREYSYADILAQALAKGGEWVYQKPRGVYSEGGVDVAEWFRMYDFLNCDNFSSKGYWHDAPAPFTFTKPTDWSATPSTYETSLTIARPSIPSTHTGLALTLSDFTGLSGIGTEILNWYFAVIHRTTESAEITHVRSNTTLSQLSAGSSITIPLTFPIGSSYGCVIAEPGDFVDGDSVIFLPGGLFSLTYSRMSVEVHCSLNWSQGTPYLDGNAVNLGGGFLRVNFTDSPMPTSGQPYVIKFQAVGGGMTVSDEITYDPRENIPSSPDSIYIDVSDIPDIPIWDGMTATALNTWVETTGVNASGVAAVLLGSLRTDQL